MAKKKGPHNSELIKSVALLYDKGLISSDKDIVDATGYHKSTVSSYINGHIEASGGFSDSFQTFYKQKLDAAFREGTLYEGEAVYPLEPSISFEKEYYEAIIRENKLLRERADKEVSLEGVREMILVNQAVLESLYTTLVKDSETDKSLLERLRKSQQKGSDAS